MVDRLASFLKQILKRNVTVVNNGVGSTCATVAEGLDLDAFDKLSRRVQFN